MGKVIVAFLLLVSLALAQYQPPIGNSSGGSITINGTTCTVGSSCTVTSGAPTTATYITQTADAGLSAEQPMAALGTGLVKNTTGTGVQSIAVAGTDFVGGQGSLVTVGAVPYVSSSGVLNQDQTAGGQFFWDATNHGLHIGNATVSASYKLDVTANGTAGVGAFQNSNSGGYSAFDLKDHAGTVQGFVGWANSGSAIPSRFYFGTVNANPVVVNVNNAEVARFAGSTGNLLIGGVTDGNYRFDVQKSGSTGTVRFFDQTATTGATRVVITKGAADAAGTTTLTSDASASFAGNVAGTGFVRSGDYTQVGTVLYLTGAARATLSSPADGVIKLGNNAENDFGRLQFGGTTSSFPALKRSTTKIQVRLADDSAAGTFEGKYNSSDASPGVTVTTCTGFKDGLCISGT